MYLFSSLSLYILVSIDKTFLGTKVFLSRKIECFRRDLWKSANLYTITNVKVSMFISLDISCSFLIDNKEKFIRNSAEGYEHSVYSGISLNLNWWASSFQFHIRYLSYCTLWAVIYGSKAASFQDFLSFRNSSKLFVNFKIWNWSYLL